MAARIQRFVAVSLNQVYNLTTGQHGLVIHRQKISNIKVVGNIRSIDKQNTKIIYTITDYTGPTLTVEFYKNQGTSPAIEEEHAYCRIYGKSCKDSFGDVYIVAFFIETLPNLNDLTIHLLEVVRDSKDLKKYKIQFLENQSTTSTNNIDHKNADNSNNHYDGNNNELVQFNGPKIVGFSEIQNLVINLVREHDSVDYGISEDEIFRQLASVNKQEIHDALKFLSNESHIYETLESHYKMAD